MSPVFIAVTLSLSALQLFIPKRYAFLPLLIAACHLGNFELFSNLTAFRLISLIGVVRAVATGSIKFSIWNRTDLFMLLFAAMAIASAPFHHDPYSNPLVFRLGFAFNVFVTYLYARAYLNADTSLIDFAKCLAICLAPLAISMSIEIFLRINLHHMLSENSIGVMLRDGKVRAVGPFRHPILAGTVGAASFPILFNLKTQHKRLFYLGTISAATVALFSNSSGPIGALLFTIGFIWLWKHRSHLKKLIGCFLSAVLAFHIFHSPAWWLIARIDLTGGSTGWHRAALIDGAIKHLGEWWLIGTDYTRHWMPTGVTWNPNHTDITNYYIFIGIMGGLPLMLIFINVLRLSLKKLILLYRQSKEEQTAKIYWYLAASLGAHCISCVAISYFGQAYIHLFLLVGLITCLRQPETAGTTTQANSNLANQARL